jgi:hypothetical protein
MNPLSTIELEGKLNKWGEIGKTSNLDANIR